MLLATIKMHRNEVHSKVSSVCRERQKFYALLTRQACMQKHDDHHAVNLLPKTLTDPQVSALSKCLIFAPTPECIHKAK